MPVNSQRNPAHVGDVIRVKLQPAANSDRWLDYVDRNGELYVVLSVGERRTYTTVYTICPTSGDEQLDIQLYQSEFTVEPFLTAVYHRKNQ